MPVIQPFNIKGLHRKDEVVIHRLRIGHTRLTHKYLMEDPFKQEPPCNFCKSGTLLTVEHIMIKCRHFDHIRLLYYSVQDMRELFERVTLSNILGFLKESRLYNQI